MGIPALKWGQHTNMHMYPQRLISLVVTNPIRKIWNIPSIMYSWRELSSDLYEESQVVKSCDFKVHTLQKCYVWDVMSDKAHKTVQPTGDAALGTVCTMKCKWGISKQRMTEEVQHTWWFRHCYSQVLWLLSQAIACNLYTVCMTFRFWKTKRSDKLITCLFAPLSTFIPLICTHSRVLCIVLKGRWAASAETKPSPTNSIKKMNRLLMNNNISFRK